MAWIKRDDSKSIEDIVRRNTGIEIEDLDDNTEYEIIDLSKASAIIRDHINKNSFITVINDYDVDGAASGAICDLLLSHLGANFKVRPPKRFSEGYGLSEKIIDEIDSGLVITVDNGIVAFNAIKKAKQKGLDVIIIDHHLPSSDGQIPEADCIIDPHFHGNGIFDNYCGAGLAYRLLKHMTTDADLIKKALALATLATVADVMPLIRENRYIVKKGLEILNQRRFCTKGLLALINASEVIQITSTTIGYKLGPLLNAPGRLLDDGSYLSYKLLAFEGNFYEACEMANNLVKLNKQRQQTVKDTMFQVEDNIEENNLTNNSCMVLFLKNICEGIVGILAGKVAEKYKRPCIVFTNKHDNPDIYKASGRTYGDINLKKLLDDNKAYLLGYGGHKAAAGLSTTEENFTQFFNSISNYLPQTEYSDDIYYDLEISAKEIPEVIRKLSKFEPFGEHNEKPIFKIKDFINSPTSSGFYKLMGDDEQHVKIYGITSNATAFDLRKRFMEEKKVDSNLFDFIGTLSFNVFNNIEENSIEVIDFINKDVTKTQSSFATFLVNKAKTRY